jgi:hypothetical protein
MTDSERQHVLRMIEEGKITPEEGLKLMQALGEDAPVEVLEAAEAWARYGEEPAKSDPEFDQKVRRFRRLWLVPLGGGILLSVLSAAWMYTALHSFWVVPALLFFLLGVGLVVLGFDSRSSRWIYIDVNEKPGEHGHIVITFPLAPIRWLASLFGRHISAEHKGVLDEQILQAVLQKSDDPFFVDAHDESGNRVQVYIG